MPTCFVLLEKVRNDPSIQLSDTQWYQAIKTKSCVILLATTAYDGSLADESSPASVLE